MPKNMSRRKEERREEAQKRAEERASRSHQFQIKRLDLMFGDGNGAKKERERLEKLIEKKNSLDSQ